MHVVLPRYSPVGWIRGLSLAALGALVGLAVSACASDPADPEAAGADAADIPGGADATASDDGAGAADVPAADADDAATGCVEGTPCDDADACTSDDRCGADGTCAGTPRDCDDGLDCTEDTCVAGECERKLQIRWCLVPEPTPHCVADGLQLPQDSCRACRAPPVGGFKVETRQDGVSCSDGDACTRDDTCVGGICAGGSPLECPDAEACQVVECDPALGCVTRSADAPCDDGNVCTVGDRCEGGGCAPGGDVPDCDDGDPCTADVCDPTDGCLHQEGVVCDDADPCTADLCLEGGECQNSVFTGPCSDGDPCTVGEACDAEGTCGGGTPRECDDGDTCTIDTCEPGLGCVNRHDNGGGCDDGEGCTSADTCWAGHCVGSKEASCATCPAPITDHALKLTVFQMARDTGLDVDQDPTTCSPSASCSDGIDNALRPLADVLNEPLQQAVDDGTTILVANFKDFTTDGTPFPLSVLDSERTTASAQAGCDWQADVCDYYPESSTFDAGCRPLFQLDDAVVSGDRVTAGGPDALVHLVFPISGATNFVLTVARARLEGTLTWSADGTRVVGVDALMGGVVLRSQIIAGIEAVDPDDLPIDKDAAIFVIDNAIHDDVDLDGDGEPDAASVGLRFQAIGARIRSRN